MAKVKKATFYIKGMHCPSCEVLINDKFRQEKKVIDVRGDFKSQKVEVFYTGHLDKNILNQKIKPFGYQIVEEKIKDEEPLGRRLFDVFAISAIILILYLIAKELNFIPSFNFSGQLSLWTIFVIGLVASTSTCMATSGALFLSLVNSVTLRQAQGDTRNFRQAQGDMEKGQAQGGSQYFQTKSDTLDSRFRGNDRKKGNDRKRKENNKKTCLIVSLMNHDNFVKAVFFNAGRIASYGFFGFLAGWVGQALITGLKLGSVLTLAAAVFMLFLGLDLTKIIKIGTLIPSKLNKALFESLEHKLIKYPRKAPFFLGAITYILPCGFTQAVQVYALGLASPILSALTMIVFALGTTPAIFLVGALSSFTKSSFYHYFMKTMGILVFAIGYLYFSNFLSLSGININPLALDTLRVSSLAPLNNGVQTIEMKVVSSGYSPNQFSVKKGIPVKWKIEGVNVLGCQAYLVVPKIGIQKILEAGENIIEFTPKEKGPIYFSCSMGMYRGRIDVVD